MTEPHKAVMGWYVNRPDVYNFDNEIRRHEGWPCSAYKGIGGDYPSYLQVTLANGQNVVFRAKDTTTHSAKEE